MSSFLVFNRVYRLEIQLVMLVFLTSLVNCFTSNLVTVSPPSPFLVWISTGLFIYFIQRVTGGRGSGCVESIYRSYTLCIWPDSVPTKLLYHPKQQPWRGGGLRKSLFWSIFKKSRHLRFESISNFVYAAVLRIHKILVCGSGSADPCLWLMDPDPGGPKHTDPTDSDPDPQHCHAVPDVMKERNGRTCTTTCCTGWAGTWPG